MSAEHVVRVEWVPLSFLYAVQDGTTLSLPGRRADAPDVVVRIPKNHGVFFRTDFVHAGSAYTEPNARFHVFVDSVYYPVTSSAVAIPEDTDWFYTHQYAESVQGDEPGTTREETRTVRARTFDEFREARLRLFDAGTAMLERESRRRAAWARRKERKARYRAARRRARSRGRGSG